MSWWALAEMIRHATEKTNYLSNAIVGWFSLAFIAAFPQQIPAQTIEAARVGEWILVPPGAPRHIAVSGGYAYLANADAGLQVVDVSTRSNPQWQTINATLQVQDESYWLNVPATASTSFFRLRRPH